MFARISTTKALLLLFAPSILFVSIVGWLWSAGELPFVIAAADPVTPQVRADEQQAQAGKDRSGPDVTVSAPELADGDEKAVAKVKKERPDGKDHEHPSAMLQHMAGQLHADAVTHFIMTPGMGYRRMGPIVRLTKRPWTTPWWSQDEVDKDMPVKETKDFAWIHLGGMKLFSDSNTVPPGKRVTHNDNPKAKKEKLWEIKALDLVGLVMHEVPVAYLSEKIPEMKDLSTKPTRPLDYFELAGLDHLMKGDKMFVRAKEGTVRVLGPIQAAKSCLKCHHDSKEGDLLGAFSYTLREAEYQLMNLDGQPFVPRKGVTPAK